jgi:hypothetical protein
MITKPFGVAFATFVFHARGRHDDADAVWLRLEVRCRRATLIEIPQMVAGFCSAILQRRSKVRFEGLGDLSLGCSVQYLKGRLNGRPLFCCLTSPKQSVAKEQEC